MKANGIGDLSNHFVT